MRDEEPPLNRGVVHLSGNDLQTGRELQEGERQKKSRKNHDTAKYQRTPIMTENENTAVPGQAIVIQTKRNGHQLNGKQRA